MQNKQKFQHYFFFQFHWGRISHNPLFGNEGVCQIYNVLLN